MRLVGRREREERKEGRQPGRGGGVGNPCTPQPGRAVQNRRIRRRLGEHIIGIHRGALAFAMRGVMVLGVMMLECVLAGVRVG